MAHADFNEDVLVEILCRLPKRCLVRFKCVSKHWLTLISDCSRVLAKTSHQGLVCQTFLPLDFRPHPSSSSSSINEPITHRISLLNFLHLDRMGNASPRLAPSHLLNDDNFFMITSCHGFLLYRKEWPTLSRTLDIVVFHPAANRAWYLSVLNWERGMHFGLAADGRHFKFAYFQISFKRDARPWFILNVFSSENEEWIQEELSLPRIESIPRKEAHSCFESANSVFLDGSFHWIWGGYLIIYHLRKAECQFLKFPPLPNNGGRRKRKDQCIWESEGHLNYCQVSARGGRVHIWALCKGTFKWKAKHKGTFNPPLTEIEQQSISFSPFAFNDDLEIVYLMSGRRIFSYNLATKAMKEACASPFEGSHKFALCITLPFLYVTQFDTAIATSGDRELCNPCRDEMGNTEKRRKKEAALNF